MRAVACLQRARELIGKYLSGGLVYCVSRLREAGSSPRPSCFTTDLQVTMVYIQPRDDSNRYWSLKFGTLNQGGQIYSFHPVDGYRVSSLDRLHPCLMNYKIGILRRNLVDFKAKLRRCSQVVQEAEPFPTQVSRSHFWCTQLWDLLALEEEREHPDNPFIHPPSEAVRTRYSRQVSTTFTQ